MSEWNVYITVKLGYLFFYFQLMMIREWSIFNAIYKNNIYANNNISESWSKKKKQLVVLSYKKRQIHSQPQACNLTPC